MKYTDHPQFKKHRRWLFDQVWYGGLAMTRYPEGHDLHDFHAGRHDAMVCSLAMFADRDPDRIREFTDRDELWDFLRDGPSWMDRIKRQVDRDMARYEEREDD